MLFKSLLLLLWTIFKVSTDFATIFPLGFLWLRDTWGPSSLTRDWTCIPWHWRVKLQPWTSSQVPWAFQETKSRVSRIRHMVEMFTLSNVAYSVLISPSARSGSHLSLYPPPPSTLFLPEFILSLFFFFSFKFSALHFIFKIIQQRGKLLGLWRLFLDVQSAFRQRRPQPRVSVFQSPCLLRGC